jgi:hypothetical protein
VSRFDELLSPVRLADESIAPLSGVRGTIILASRRTLRTRALLDTLEASLPLGERMALGAVVANDVVPIHLVDAYENALERLDLRRDEARSIGSEVARTTAGIELSLVRLAGRLGATPEHALRLVAKSWNRAHVGGRVVVTHAGIRSAHVEVRGDSLARYRHHREAFGGRVLHGLGTTAHSARCEEIPECRTTSSFAFAVGW